MFEDFGFTQPILTLCPLRSRGRSVLATTCRPCLLTMALSLSTSTIGRWWPALLESWDICWMLLCWRLRLCSWELDHQISAAWYDPAYLSTIDLVFACLLRTVHQCIEHFLSLHIYFFQRTGKFDSRAWQTIYFPWCWVERHPFLKWTIENSFQPGRDWILHVMCFVDSGQTVVVMTNL